MHDDGEDTAEETSTGETSTEETSTEDADHLEAMLNGVTTDLQLGAEEESADDQAAAWPEQEGEPSDDGEE